MDFCPLYLEIMVQFEQNAPKFVVSHDLDNMSLVTICVLNKMCLALLGCDLTPGA